jgi:hypothetical protein
MRCRAGVHAPGSASTGPGSRPAHGRRAGRATRRVAVRAAGDGFDKVQALLAQRRKVVRRLSTLLSSSSERVGRVTGFGFQGGEQSVATPQAVRGWARPLCRHFKIQSCCCLGGFPNPRLPYFGGVGRSVLASCSLCSSARCSALSGCIQPHCGLGTSTGSRHMARGGGAGGGIAAHGPTTTDRSR